jgi:hypothetical protein
MDGDSRFRDLVSAAFALIFLAAFFAAIVIFC